MCCREIHSWLQRLHTVSSEMVCFQMCNLSRHSTAHRSQVFHRTCTQPVLCFRTVSYSPRSLFPNGLVPCFFRYAYDLWDITSSRNVSCEEEEYVQGITYSADYVDNSSYTYFLTSIDFMCSSSTLGERTTRRRLRYHATRYYYSLGLSFSLPPIYSRNSNPGSQGRLFSLLPTTVRAFFCFARRVQDLPPSSTRVELVRVRHCF